MTICHDRVAHTVGKRQCHTVKSHICTQQNTAGAQGQRSTPDGDRFIHHPRIIAADLVDIRRGFDLDRVTVLNGFARIQGIQTTRISKRVGNRISRYATPKLSVQKRVVLYITDRNVLPLRLCSTVTDSGQGFAVLKRLLSDACQACRKCHCFQIDTTTADKMRKRSDTVRNDQFLNTTALVKPRELVGGGVCTHRTRAADCQDAVERQRPVNILAAFAGKEHRIVRANIVFGVNGVLRGKFRGKILFSGRVISQKLVTSDEKIVKKLLSLVPCGIKVIVIVPHIHDIPAMVAAGGIAADIACVHTKGQCQTVEQT